MVRQPLQLARGFGFFIQDLFRSRHLIMQLAMREFRGRYLGSSFGLLWAVLHPLTTLLLYWFVLQLVFANPDVGDVPFVLWLMAGMVPWFFFSETLGSGASAILENGYLVKKVVFRVNMLPVVKLLAALPIHILFMGLTVALFLAYRKPVGVHSVQVLYYMFAGCCLTLGVSFLTSALMPFLRDTSQVVAVVIQFLFWLTPVIWSTTSVPEAKRATFMPLLKANPLFYLVQGYRESLIPGQATWFWQHPVYTLYFWAVTGVIMIVGMLVFRQLRPHFADVV
jgi:lipopolysaccharide transport system permease protein/teichoic acid transport system permease protein